jgi:putative transposase
MVIEFKGSHFERDMILWAVRWYVAYLISYRQLEEMMEEYGVEVDHATLNRWVRKYLPLLDREFRTRNHPVGRSWRTVGFLLPAKRDQGRLAQGHQVERHA